MPWPTGAPVSIGGATVSAAGLPWFSSPANGWMLLS
jgi:hypothetical protein